MNKKKIWAGLFLTMLVSFIFGMSAMAASSTVAKIGNTKYTSLETAIKKVKTGQTIVLQKDLSYTKDLTINRSGKEFTINLNKHTITFKKASSLVLKKGTVSIRNGKLKATEILDSDYEPAYLIKTGTAAALNIISGTYNGVILNQGTLTVSGGKLLSLNSGDGNNGAVITNTGTLKISGGTFTQQGNLFDVIYNNTKSAKLTITGGTFGGGTAAIRNEDSATAVIRDGTFESESYSIRNWGAKITITGGTFTASNCVENNGTLTIKGGTFNGTYKAVYTEGGTVKITEGTFTSKKDYTVCAIGGTVKISGGKFKLSSAGALLYARLNAKITVTDGTFIAKKGYRYGTEDSGKVTIKGGTFTTKGTRL
ncbi:MAG: hypothetical protein LIP12_17285 [Clostridiales bacterium]|nr:hypothetical protein [Clostridiales bacterium]